jgi:hypothetical protein
MQTKKIVDAILKETADEVDTKFYLIQENLGKDIKLMREIIKMERVEYAGSSFITNYVQVIGNLESLLKQVFGLRQSRK